MSGWQAKSRLQNISRSRFQRQSSELQDIPRSRFQQSSELSIEVCLFGGEGFRFRQDSPVRMWIDWWEEGLRINRKGKKAGDEEKDALREFYTWREERQPRHVTEGRQESRRRQTGINMYLVTDSVVFRHVSDNRPSRWWNLPRVLQRQPRKIGTSSP